MNWIILIVLLLVLFLVWLHNDYCVAPALKRIEERLERIEEKLKEAKQ